MARATLLALLAYGAAALVALPSLASTNGSDLTVSGLSSGAYMAVQLHVAFSSRFRGAGILAGGPFFCAQDLINVALTSCMVTPSLISVAELERITKNTRYTLTIDALSNLKADRVWLFSGSQDTVIAPGVVRKLEEYYGKWISQAGGVKTVYDVPAEHAWPTDGFGSDCSYKGEPYINNCGFDAAGEMLQHLYFSQLKPPAGPSSQVQAQGQLLLFDQRPFLPGVDISMPSTGYLYVPLSCTAESLTKGGCGLHVSLHGCQQATSVVGTQFVERTGLNAWADANNLVILYPQATSNVIPFNPKGCWDWWGYTGANYASKLGVQMRAIMSMVDHVLGRKAVADATFV